MKSRGRVQEYLGHFHPKFIGLTGSEEDLKYVADLYKVFYTRAEAAENSDNYMIDHSSFVYLMDKNGKYMKHFYMNTPEEEIISLDDDEEDAGSGGDEGDEEDEEVEEDEPAPEKASKVVPLSCLGLGDFLTHTSISPL